MGGSVSGHGHGAFLDPREVGDFASSQADDSQDTTSNQTPPNTPTAPGHRRQLAKLSIPPTSKHLLGSPGTFAVAGHGHAAQAHPSPLSSTSAPPTPSLPRPSARASRRSSLFSSAADSGRDPASESASPEDPSSDVARDGLMPSIADAQEELSDGEHDGHVDPVGTGVGGASRDGGVERESPSASLPPSTLH